MRRCVRWWRGMLQLERGKGRGTLPWLILLIVDGCIICRDVPYVPFLLVGRLVGAIPH